MQIIVTVIFVYLFAVFQYLYVNNIMLFHFIPNILLSLLIYSHLKVDLRIHAFIFFVCGIMLDCTNPLMFGVNTFGFMLASYAVSIMKEHLDIRSITNRIIIVLMVNILYYLLFSITYSVVYSFDLLEFALSVLLGSLINTLLSVLLILCYDVANYLSPFSRNE